MKKILSISSPGGHWTQLLRLKKSFSCNIVTYSSTIKGYHTEVPGAKFHQIRDASRWSSKIQLVLLFYDIIKLLLIVKPNIVITTGAAPGLLCVILARFFGAKTIWVDSIANYKQLSLSGRLAKNFTHLHLTQWKHLATSKTQYLGSVL